jgi:hypothetical protein
VSDEVIRIVSVDVDAAEAAMLRTRGWRFDWSQDATELIDGPSVLKALLIGGEIERLVEYEILRDDLYVFAHKLEIDPRNRGHEAAHAGVAGMLLAYLGRESFRSGCDGFVVLVSKSVLYDHYRKRYGAKALGGLRLYFDTAASSRLIEEYLVGKEIGYE